MAPSYGQLSHSLAIEFCFLNVDLKKTCGKFKLFFKNYK